MICNKSKPQALLLYAAENILILHTYLLCTHMSIIISYIYKGITASSEAIMVPLVTYYHHPLWSL